MSIFATAVIAIVAGAVGGLAGRWLAKRAFRKLERKMQDELVEVREALDASTAAEKATDTAISDAMRAARAGQERSTRDAIAGGLFTQADRDNLRRRWRDLDPWVDAPALSEATRQRIERGRERFINLPGIHPPAPAAVQQVNRGLQSFPTMRAASFPRLNIDAVNHLPDSIECLTQSPRCQHFSVADVAEIAPTVAIEPRQDYNPPDAAQASPTTEVTPSE